MARPKEFDPEVALDAAIEVFRHYGYEATSVAELVEAMGIHRASLYDTFGDKHDLYIAALDRYDRKKFAEYRAIVNVPGSRIAAIHRLFENIVENVVATGGITFGCLMTNSTMELASVDPKIAARATRNFEEMTNLFMIVLQEARESDELCRSEREMRALSRFLVNTIKGLRVSAKADCSRETLNDIVGVALSVLK